MEETVSISFVTRDLKKFEVEANTFTVVVNQKSARVIRDGASRHKWEFNVVQRERWIKTDDGLKLSSLEGLEVVYMIKDGKLIEGSRGKKPKGRLPHGTILKSKDLVLVGTIMEINPRAGGVSRKNWAVVVRVERVVAGEFSGMTFTFAIHSPAMSGLRLGQAYTIKATWTPEGYVVGSTVEEARAPRMKKAGNH
jgi:hypothetical protein